LIRSRVRLRFALTGEEFADLVIERALAAGEPDSIAYARLLSLDDLYLAQACVGRDEQAWREFARQHVDFMREFAGRFLRGIEATDLTDQVVADLWEKGKLARYEGRSTLRTWLGAVTAHAALQAGKVSRRRAEGPDNSDPPPATAPEDAQAARLLADITAEAIGALPRDQKLLLLLHYEQGLSLDQIGALLSTSKATLSRRLKQVRTEVRAVIERAARERYRSTGDAVRARVDLGRLELDLSALLAGVRPVKGTGGDGV
jgi:RNA polymerase sigma-70 factor (ECF subfamily)